MARKSRKNIDAAVVGVPAAAKVYNVGAYVRLSAVDRKKKGDSIENQQAIISAFVAGRSDMVIREVYIDNGTTGQTFEREGFQRMLADMESGKIDCCVSKDLSRLGRNAIDTGYYIEKYFPTHGIRYIAINDNYDSNNGNSGGITVSLKNMVNETYALEVGRKVHKTRQMNIKNGCFVGGFAPYGYLKDPKGGHKLIPDPYASEIVRSIFEMFANGRGVTAILNHLNEQGITPPNLYRHTNSGNAAQAAKSNTYWTNVVIYEILNNQLYCGDMVQGRSTTKQHVSTWNKTADLVITPNTHEGLVSRELFEAAQAKKGTSFVSRERIAVNIFAKKLYCGHCGYAIHHEMRKNKTDAYYFCPSRKYHGKSVCVPVPVSIGGATLNAQILELLRKQATVFAERRDITVKENATANSAELTRTKQELDRTSGFLKGLYESLVSGDITNAEYNDMKSAYEAKIAKLTEREQQLRDEIRESFLRESTLKKASNNLDNVSVISDLTAEVVDALIDKILLFEDKHIEVTFKFTDEPMETQMNGRFVWKRNRPSKKDKERSRLCGSVTEGAVNE
ncbi:resolvase [Clostridia bacterium]|nr:resolvase [Clostridia bacterium]